MKKKRVVLSAGGTGGHLFPAQSLARDLSNWEVLFAAGELKSNRFFDRESFSFEEVDCATFSFTQPLKILKGCCRILKGVRQCQHILRCFNPDLVVGFGSFFTLPVLTAALIEKVPIILHEQNAVLGKVNRLFASFAHKTTITFPKTRDYLKGKALKKSVEVIFPLRKLSTFNQEECWKYFDLEPSKPTLLVFGGSQGATRLNTLVLDAMTQLKNYQVLHFTGNDARSAEAKKRYQDLHIPACVKSFEPFMDRAMRIADYAVTRAGASTIAELIEYELPALLIPYPHATDNHQEKNGAHFVSLVKAGKMYKENELGPALLAETILQQLPCLQAMKKNIASYKKERQAVELAALIEEFVHGKD
jgi:UDP-N-acetylglucosamine--N-acetylmuramyl-(pentapeptide) pyrophosphoryl-undecaprenol N-acetylglucosamine transferase